MDTTGSLKPDEKDRSRKDLTFLQVPDSVMSSSENMTIYGQKSEEWPDEDQEAINRLFSDARIFINSLDVKIREMVCRKVLSPESLERVVREMEPRGHEAEIDNSIDQLKKFVQPMIGQNRRRARSKSPQSAEQPEK